MTKAMTWTFLTNHAHVLSCLHREPDVTLREVAARVGITERAAHRIVGELESAGYLEHRRIGRRNLYSVRRELPLRHPLDRHRSVGDLLDLIDETVDH
ncbi:MAG: winged helix-turn-helix domain-containing protein [Acidimicrobiia bacterium]|jgi:DNA-binding Lrp family transcriptional regulator